MSEIDGGPYEVEAEELHKRDGADAIVILSLGGKRGSGLSIYAAEEHTSLVIALLRKSAEELEGAMLRGELFADDA